MAQIDPQRGEVWFVDLKTDSTAAGTDKPERPAVVVSVDTTRATLPVRIVVPITGWDASYNEKPWHVKLLSGTAGLTKESSADCFGLRTVALDRFRKKKGTLDKGDMENVEAALKMVLSLK